MDTNRFKSSHDFSNIQKNLHNNPGYHTESLTKQSKDFAAEMKSQNNEDTKNAFLNHTQKSAHGTEKQNHPQKEDRGN